jgi:UDP-N-acetylglucosamine 1-carboxyvinyltransferase
VTVSAGKLAQPPPALTDDGDSMYRIRARGGRALHGSVRVSGAKNATLPIMAAALLTDDPCTIDNVPILADIYVMADLLRHLGATVDIDEEGHRVTIQARDIVQHYAPEELVERMRASFLVSGPVLARTGRIETTPPGGCKLGSRPVDVDVRGFRRMGADVQIKDDGFRISTGRLEGADIYMDYPSHTGTENLLMAATLARGVTTIVNAASEPEIAAVGNVLREMGARIDGLGTPHLRIEGVERLRGFQVTVLPDRLEAGTFAIGAVITGGEVVLERVNERDMIPLTSKLREAGAEVWWSESSMLVRTGRTLDPLEVQALPFPGFPTDLQAAFAVLLTQATGTSRVFDRVYNDRMKYLHELEKMNARFDLVSNQEARIYGPTKLKGADVTALDIRAGACLILAGLIAEGESTIDQIHHVRRGYEDIVAKFQSLGADVSYA